MGLAHMCTHMHVYTHTDAHTHTPSAYTWAYRNGEVCRLGDEAEVKGYASMEPHHQLVL